MGNGDRIVVETVITIERYENWSMVAARLRALGLTAYGHTKEEARDAVKHLFYEFINMHRSAGDLEEHLRAIGVTPEPEATYKGQYEVTRPFPRRTRPAVRDVLLDLPVTAHTEAADEPMALAA